jgi:hypothetical protein
MGMWMSFTKNPMKPMIKNPTDVANAILENSAAKHAAHTPNVEQSQHITHSRHTKTRKKPQRAAKQAQQRHSEGGKVRKHLEKEPCTDATSQPPLPNHAAPQDNRRTPTLRIWLFTLDDEICGILVELRERVQLLLCGLAAAHA